MVPVGGFIICVGGWGFNAVWWLDVIVEFGADITFNFIEASLLSTGGVSPLGIELDSGGGSNKGAAYVQDVYRHLIPSPRLTL